MIPPQAPDSETVLRIISLPPWNTSLEVICMAPKKEEPIPGNIYPVIDNDLARDNLENDLPLADLTDLRKS